MNIRRAAADELAVILTWRQQTADWLQSIGSDQWSDAGLSDSQFTDRVQRSIADGDTWIAEVDHLPVGTIAIDQWSDPELWFPGELDYAVVVHRMIVPRQHSGQGIGAALLDHADTVALNRGADTVVLDAWTSNHELHTYYERQGFEHVRTIAGKSSGALFRRRVQRALASIDQGR